MARVIVRRKLTNNRQTVQKKYVFIGLDFGTTFTKVSYRISGGNTLSKVYTIHFTDSKSTSKFFKESVIFKDKENLYYNKTDGAQEVKYFKYNMINNVLKSDNEHPQEDSKLAQYYSIFFLANLIKSIKEQIMSAPTSNLSSDNEISWCINMGVPIDDYETDAQKKDIYDETLCIAYTISDLVYETMSLQDFIELVEMNKDIGKLSNLNTVPELYAESLFFQMDKNIPNGFYGIIDVGGGTVDIATFHKRNNGDGETVTNCISKDITTLGVETLISKIVNNPGLKTERKKARDYLINSEDINYHLDNFIERIDCPAINRHMLKYNHKCIRLSFGYCFTNKLRIEIGLQKMLNEPISYFIAGGGKDIPIYKKIFKRMESDFNNGLKTKQQFFEVELDKSRFYNDNYVEHNDRIITSQMLAQDIYSIPQIQSWPWNFSSKEEYHDIDVKSQLEKNAEKYRD